MSLSYNQIIYSGFSAILFALLAGIFAFKSLTKSAKIITLLLVVTLVTEILADFCARKYKTNLMVYALFNPIQFFLIACFFNYSITSFTKKHIGIFIGLFFALFGYVNVFVFQKLYQLNNIFLLTESVAIVAMCLYNFYYMLLSDDDLSLTTLPDFWFTSIFLFFWLGTFFVWGLYDTLTRSFALEGYIIHGFLISINIITYLAFATVFLFYKKMLRAK